MKTPTRLLPSLRPDLAAGLTVAMVVIPQSLAYASIANVNPIYGVYTAIIPTIIGALFGSSRYLVTGPTNATALVTLSVLAFAANSPHYLELVFALAVLAGLFKLAFGLLRLGGITRFISNAVLIGFLTAAGILISLEQLGNLLGLSLPKGEGAAAIVIAAIRGANEINPYTLITGAAAALVMLAAGRASKKLPAALLAIIAAGALVYYTGWAAEGVRLVSDLGLPENPMIALHLPQVSRQDLQALVPAAGTVALFSMVEAMSIAKALNKSDDPAMDLNREFIGQGLASIAGGLTQCIPSSGSPSRSAVLMRAGARTHFAAAFSGMFVWISLILFIGLIGEIPTAALAVVVIVSALGLINPAEIRFTWKAHIASRAVMIVTFASAMLFPLEYAIYIGVIFSILLYLFDTTRLKLTILEFNNEGAVIEHPLSWLSERRPRVAALNIEGAFCYGSNEQVENAIRACQEAGVRTLVLRLRSAHSIASTGTAGLISAIQVFQNDGGVIFISGVDRETRHMLDKTGVSELVGAGRIIERSEVLYAATRQALADATQAAQAV